MTQQTTELDATIESVREVFVNSSIDSRIEEALPILAKIKENTMREADVFENWTNQVMEGTWALPETEEDMAKLRELMSKPLPCGPDGEYASEQLYSLIGDDELFDNIGELADKDPDADCREIVKARAKELGVEIDVEESLNESPAGNALQMAYDKVYDFVGEYDDAALEYLNDNAPIFQQMFDKYDGELDVMASKLDANTLNQIMDELNDVAYDLEGGVLESKVQENDIEMEEDCGCEDDAMVSVPVQELADILQLAGYENYADKIEEYANEPEEEYSDTEDQLIGLSGGLNRPKKQYPASAPGDNPMDQEPREIEESVEDKLYKSYKDFLEAEEIKSDD